MMIVFQVNVVWNNRRVIRCLWLDRFIGFEAVVGFRESWVFFDASRWQDFVGASHPHTSGKLSSFMRPMGDRMAEFPQHTRVTLVWDQIHGYRIRLSLKGPDVLDWEVAEIDTEGPIHEVLAKWFKPLLEHRLKEYEVAKDIRRGLTCF